MKKSLVLVALAGAMTLSAASAETILYGSIRMGLENSKNHYGLNHENSTYSTKRGFDMKDYGSRLGLKGSEDLGNGTKVVFQLEWGFDGMEGVGTGDGFHNRLAWLGLTGDWGTFAIGRQNNPFTEALNAGTEADEFNGDYISALRYATGSVMFASESAIGGQTAMPTRVGNSIAYISPNWSGFNFVVAGVADAPKAEFNAAGDLLANSVTTFNRNRNFDIYTLSLNYEHESGFYAKAAWLSSQLFEDAKRANAYGLNLGFKNEQFGVNVDYGAGSRGQKHDFYSNVGNSAAKVTSKGWDIGAHFSFGPDYFSTVRATYGQSTVDYKNIYAGTDAVGYNVYNKNKDKMTVWAIGFEQKLSNRTKVWVEYAKEENKFTKGTTDIYSTSNTTKTKNDVFSVGLRHDF